MNELSNSEPKSINEENYKASKENKQIPTESIKKLFDNSKCTVQSTKIILLSFYEALCKKIKEIFSEVKGIVKRTYSNLLERFSTAEQENIEV